METVDFLKHIFSVVKTRFNYFVKYQKVIIDKDRYQSTDLLDGQLPEELVKEYIVRPLLEHFGYDLVGETTVNSPFGRRAPDFVAESYSNKKRYFLVEVEPINKDLDSKNSGTQQIREWLLSRAAGTDYGLATDGLTWIFVKFDLATNRIAKVLTVDLRPVVSLFLNASIIGEMDKVKNIIYQLLFLKKTNFETLVNNFLIESEAKKEDITTKFYQKYSEMVFGRNSKGNITSGVSLISSITEPNNNKKHYRELFALITMNRLFFISFLQDKKLISSKLLMNLYNKYQKEKSSILKITFYSGVIKRLFYEVFNTESKQRSDEVKGIEEYKNIPYLNGGLFRFNIEDEDMYDIKDEGMDLILNFLDEYNIGLEAESELKPEILGYIFEKTINYLSGHGNEKQKEEGAYYTPDDVVNFIIEKTVINSIYKAMIATLKTQGWGDRDLRSYDSVESILSCPPKNPKLIETIISSIYRIRVLDPACGSGHFLVAATNAITRIVTSLNLTEGKTPDQYEIKREVISNNIFGVDIDEIGVEITKLRLWLSVISEIDVKNINDFSSIGTLPNIDFNIIYGNSLTGQFNEQLSLTLEDFNDVIDISEFNTITSITEEKRRSIEELINSNRIDKISEGYMRLLQIYRTESGNNAFIMHHDLLAIRKRVYQSIDSAFFSYLVMHTDKKNKEIPKSKEELNIPFHWKFDFYSIFNNGGFDVVIGNPPYIESKNSKKQDISTIKFNPKLLKGTAGKDIKPIYESQKCGNTFAYFIERSIKLMKKDGDFGFIVPISLVSTPRMSSIREFIQKNSEKVEYFNFDDRPGKLFSGTQHSRSTIVFTKKGEGTNTVITSKYHRWYTSDRPSLFNNLSSVTYKLRNKGEIVPKIGTDVELSILSKLYSQSKGKTLGDYKQDNGQILYYYDAPQYWIHTSLEDLVPENEYYEYQNINGKTKLIKLTKKEISSHYKSIYFSPRNAIISSSIMNSSLFYWWFIITSDGRDLTYKNIADFPGNLDLVSDKQLELLSSLLDELMKDYQRKAKVKINIRKGGMH